MNILINSLAGGGAEIQNILLAKTDKKSKIFLLEETVDYDYGKINLIHLNKNELLKSSIFRYLKTPISAQRLAKQLDKDSIIVVSLFRSLLAAVFCKLFFKRKIKIIYWIHSDPDAVPKGIFSRLYNFLYLKTYQNCNGIITNSKMGARTLEQNFGINKSKIFVVYNGFGLKNIISKSNIEITDQRVIEILKNPTVVVVGRLETVKGHKYLISIFKEVVKEIPNANLILLGEGKLREEFKTLIKHNKLEQNVHLLGFQKNPFQIIKRASVLAFTSLHEGFGNVIVESLACGTPVISSDINNGPREILAPKSDIYFRTTVPEKLESGYLMPSLKELDQNKIKMWGDTLIQILNKKVTFSPEKMEERSRAFDIINLKPQFASIIKQIKSIA